MNMQKWLRVGIAGLVALLAVQSNGAPPVGAYYGVVRRDTTVFSPITVVCGTFSMNTTARGRITAKIALRERTLSFKAEGWQETEGGPHVRMEGRGGEVLELLSLANLGTVGTLSGGSLGDKTMNVLATYHAFADQTDAAAQAKLAHMQGYYTVALVCWDVLQRGAAWERPEGHGYLTMTVGPKGKVKIAGVLADGTKVSQASTLMTTISVPFFRPLYRRQGEIGGLLLIYPDTRDLKFAWNPPAVYWDKLGSGPDGFQALLATVGGYFIKGAPLPEPTYELWMPGVIPYYYLSDDRQVPPQYGAVPKGVSVTSTGTRLVAEKGIKPVLSDDGTHYVYTGENSSLATLRYSPHTGIFRGSFNLYYDDNSGGKLMHKVVKVPFAGVMTRLNTPLEDTPPGLGYCLMPDTNPAFRALRIKHSAPMALHPVLCCD